MSAVIEIQDICKHYHIYEKPVDRLKQLLRPKKQYYRTFAALTDVSFTVSKGESVGILGVNGSGKSTLLQIIANTLNASQGDCKVHGKVAALLELGTGFNPEFTGRENIYLYGAILGLSNDQINQKLSQIVAFSELEAFIDQPTKTYSSGMYVRLAFSVAIHVDPEILIVDEALAVGDARFQLKCLNKIKQLQNSGLTILFVSHDVSMVRALCKRAVWLEQGRVKQIGEVIDVTASYIESIYDEADHHEDPVDSENETFEAINHWGPNMGCIQEIALKNANGVSKNAFELHNTIGIHVSFNQLSLSTEHGIKVAFSIKSPTGTDLIVGHHNIPPEQVPNLNATQVVFQLENQLAPGDYLLAIAIEKDEAGPTDYLEYIEGSHILKSISSNQDPIYGLFSPSISSKLLFKNP